VGIARRLLSIVPIEFFRGIEFATKLNDPAIEIGEWL